MPQLTTIAFFVYLIVGLAYFWQQCWETSEKERTEEEYQVACVRTITKSVFWPLVFLFIITIGVFISIRRG